MLLLAIRKEIVHNVLSFRFIVTYALLFCLVLLAVFLMANDFTGDDLNSEVAALVTTCQAAEAMGVPAVRVDIVLRKADMPEDEFVERCAGAVRSALEATSSVKIGVENHGSTSNRPELLDKLFPAVGDLRFGLTLDSGWPYK